MEGTQIRKKVQIIDFIRKRPQLFILVGMAIILTVTPPKYASAANIINIFKQVFVISIICCGMTLVVVSGALDLSVGSALSLLTVVSANLQLKNDLAAVLVPLGVAVLLGLFNGLIITTFNVNSIIVTLGSLALFSGLALLYVNGAIIIGIPDTWYSQIAQGKLLNIPFHVIIFIIIAIIYELLLSKTRFGSALRYIGTNKEAAKIAGIQAKKIQVIAFVISAVSVAIAGIILSSRMNSGSPVAGVGIEFDAITAIVIGGTSLSGGKGNIRSTVIGVLLLAVIVNALTLYNVPYAFQNISKGILIIVAITADIRSKEKYGK